MLLLTSIILEILSNDSNKSWPANKTIMMSMTSKSIKDVLCNLSPSVYLRINHKWFNSQLSFDKKQKIIKERLYRMSTWCCKLTIELSDYMYEQLSTGIDIAVKYNINININILKYIDVNNIKELIISYKEKLGLYNDCIRNIDIILEYLSHDDIFSNYQSVSIAAGIILLISKIYNLDINKKKISSTLDISKVSINKIYNKINNQDLKDIIIK
jgi:transcription initiation factor TFIIIB Brf1 subunit/transcription initiation factor TFIIB